MAAPFDVTLLDEVRRTAQAFSQLLEHTSGLPPDVAASIQSTCEQADRVPNEARIAVAMVGEAFAGRRTLLAAAIGDGALRGAAQRQDRRTTLVRRAPAFDYIAHSRSGRRFVQFARRMPDRGPALQQQLEVAQRDIEDAAAAHAQLRSRLETSRARLGAIEADLERVRATLEASEEAATVARESLRAAEAQRASCDATVRQAAPIPHVYLATPPWWAFWLWILRLLLFPLWRERLRIHSAQTAALASAQDAIPAQSSAAAAADDARGALDQRHGAQLAKRREETDEIAAIERELAELPSMDVATVRVQRLRGERDRHANERWAKFCLEVQAFEAGDIDIAELTVELPTCRLPEGLTLIDLPSPSTADGRRDAAAAIRREADALLFVVDVERPPSTEALSFVEAMQRHVPLVLVVLAASDRLIDATRSAEVDGASRFAQERFARDPKMADRFEGNVEALFARIHDERAVILGAGAAMRMRSCVADLSAARAAAADWHRKRLATLESQRIPDPRQFGERQLARMETTIGQSADDVLRSASELVVSSMGTLKAEYCAKVDSCTSRSDVEACVRAIHESAPLQIAEVLDRTSEHVAHELQEVAESLERWALEEIHARYRVARLGAEMFSPVASELTREDLERELHALPAAGAIDAFEKQRVGYGLGGAAAGAVIGTLIAPGIGTAIGAFVGVFAGFLKGVDALKEDCRARIEVRMSDAEKHALQQLAARRTDLGRMIRASLQDALEQALAKLESAIARLMAVERRAIETSRATLETLDAARGALKEHDARLAGLIDAAMGHLGRTDRS